jgi:Inovirus Coat protein B
MKNAKKVMNWTRNNALRFGGGALALAVTGSAMAQTGDDFSTGVLAELTGGHTQVYAICSAIIGIISVIVLYRLVRKAA